MGKHQWRQPALHRLATLVDALHERAFLVSVETQGSVWRDWLSAADRLTVSPKPPSSGMASPRHERQFEAFMDSARATRAVIRAILKIVCFDERDVVWAKRIAARHPDVPLILSAGTPIGAKGPVRELLGESYRWLCERAAGDSELADVRVLPQMHVIAWKQARGV